MYQHLQSLGYTILRWEEWCEDHLEYEVIAPNGECIIAQAEGLLAPVGGPRSTVSLPPSTVHGRWSVRSLAA